MRDVVDELYLTQHRLSAERIVQEMRGRAREHRLHPPSASTVERRIAASSLEERRRRGDIVAPIAVAGKIPSPEVPHAILAAKCLIDDDPTRRQV